MQINGNETHTRWGVHTAQTSSLKAAPPKPKTPAPHAAPESEKERTQIQSLSQKSQIVNARNHINYLKAADEWYQHVEGILKEVGGLAKQAEDDATAPEQRIELQKKVDQLKKSLREIAKQEPKIEDFSDANAFLSNNAPSISKESDT